MNKARRKELSRILELIDTARVALEQVLEDEQAAFDNMPESLQDSERGEIMSDGISAMEDLLYSLEDTEALYELAEG